MNDLNEHDNKMNRIIGNLGTVNDISNSAKKVMGIMGRRVVTNKLVMAIIILVLLAAIGLIVYFKFFSGPSEPEPPTTGPPSPTKG